MTMCPPSSSSLWDNSQPDSPPSTPHHSHSITPTATTPESVRRVPNLVEEEITSWTDTIEAVRCVPKAMAAPSVASTVALKVSKHYEENVFKHRSILSSGTDTDRFHSKGFYTHARANCPHSPMVSKYEDDQVKNEDDQVTNYDEILTFLLKSESNEAMWEAELYHRLLLQHPKLRVTDEAMSHRFVQHTIKEVVQSPDSGAPFWIHPPIVTKFQPDASITPQPTAPAWIAEHLTKLSRFDMTYAWCNKGFWDHRSRISPLEEVRASLPGYRFFDQTPHKYSMLPYLLVEHKKWQFSKNAETIQHAKAYLTFHAASLLHQRLKLRSLGKLPLWELSKPLTVHCLVLAGRKAHHIEVGVRGARYSPFSVRFEAFWKGLYDLCERSNRDDLRSLLHHIHEQGRVDHEQQECEIDAALDQLRAETCNHDPAFSTELLRNSTVLTCRTETLSKKGDEMVLRFGSYDVDAPAPDPISDAVREERVEEESDPVWEGRLRPRP